MNLFFPVGGKLFLGRFEFNNASFITHASTINAFSHVPI